jgi:hypothetical protein
LGAAVVFNLAAVKARGLARLEEVFSSVVGKGWRLGRSIATACSSLKHSPKCSMGYRLNTRSLGKLILSQLILV